MLSLHRTNAATLSKSLIRHSSSNTASKYKVVVVGGGNAGITVASQIYNRFKQAGKALNPGDIAIVDANQYHYYQVCSTLVSSGIRQKEGTRRPLNSVIPQHISHISENVKSFSPESSSLTTASGSDIKYDTLVVAAGLQINWNAIEGLPEALADPNSGVASIYSYETCDKTWREIEKIKSGNAIFTQPAGVVKCAGAPQKIMWMAWDRLRRTGRFGDVKVDFYTGMPTMFSVKKYSDALNELREQRGVGGHFQHNLVAVDPENRQATFKNAEGNLVKAEYTMLHVTPPMGPLDFIKGSPIADATGWVSVDQYILQHTDPRFSNVFALGDCSSLPTSKTIAAITSQAPVLTENLFSFMDSGKVGKATYDGYTSCPLLTGYGELMLAEFKYGGEPKETFSALMDQGKSQRLFYYLKKDIFPAAYWNFMLQGKWFGSRGIFQPTW
ncbi:hypothetical protein BDZ97DRAFT_1665663 [Flammula alnicola]|nr:hypothetical protein BDZ97DRAFT_1665663 [Flammula alnicola]